MIPRITRNRTGYFTNMPWTVRSDGGGISACPDLTTAIRYWLWHCGVPAKIAFLGKTRKK